MDHLLPLLYTLAENLIKFTSLRDEVSFIPNSSLLVCDTIHSNFINENMLIKPKNLKKLSCAIKNTKMKDFTHLKALDVLSFIIEGPIFPVIKLPKSLISVKIYESCIRYSIVDVYVHFKKNIAVTKLLNVGVNNCTVRFCHELNVNCSSTVREGKIIVKKNVNYLRIEKKKKKNGWCPLSKRKPRQKMNPNANRVLR